jgi:CHAT domain-containing protein
MADPDYDLRTGVSTTGHRTVRDLQGVNFGRLPDTRREADAIAVLIKNGMGIKVRKLLGAEAREKALFGQSQPAVLHLATHGFFLQGDKKNGAETRGLKAVLIDNAGAAGSAPVKNPMLRSGIALAGVNSSLANGTDDGFVTAEKILGMRLKGTDLVTLSACETGVGELHDGEGVFGLKRAFILAGARTVVLSLWSVPSSETTELMTEFYRQMASGVPKAAALRKAQLAMLRKYPHPFYWGAFLLVGSPD